MFSKTRSGMTLIETAVATALAAVFIAVSITIVLQAQAIANSAALKNQSTVYAEQLKERVLAFKKTNSWSVLKSSVSIANGYGEVNIGTDTLSALTGICTPSNNAPISGTSTFTQCLMIKDVTPTADPRLIIVTVNIYYTDRGNPKTTTLTFYLSDT